MSYQVTRPGLALIASAMAVELTVGLLHHPLGGAAPADDATPLSIPLSSKFGLLPHTIRGYLSHFIPLIVTGRPFDRCSACSSRVVQAYRERGAEFVCEVINGIDVLDRVTGLDELHAGASDACVDWDEDDE
jgi:ubiquitin-like modifier-activating enzyme ATG7